MIEHLRFGVNGWQAVLADQFTFENIKQMVQAITNYVKKQQSSIDNFPPHLIIGFDGRFMGKHFAEVATEVITQNGLDVFLCEEPVPTPVCSWMIADMVAAGAVMITGANESMEYNGIKFINSQMALATDLATHHVEDEIENIIETDFMPNITISPGGLNKIDPYPAYIKQISGLVDLELISKTPMTVIVDYLNGIASNSIGKILRSEHTILYETRNDNSPDFRGVIPSLTLENLFSLRQVILKVAPELGLGLAIDGDGSNVKAVGVDGTVIPHDVCFGLLIYYLHQYRSWQGKVIMPTDEESFAFKVTKQLNIPMHFTPSADFRLITYEMVNQKAVLASDGLGGYAFKQHIMERDGILAAFLLMEMIAKRQKNLGYLIGELQDMLGI